MTNIRLILLVLFLTTSVMFNLTGFLLKVYLFNLIYFLVIESLKIGNKVTDFFTRDEYNR